MNTTIGDGVFEERLTLRMIQEAHARIKGKVHRTPLFTSSSIDRIVGAELFFKCENLQRVGAFKARGAANAVLSLDAATAERGIITHSSGNHGAAVSWAASLRGIPAYIVMPRNAPKAKIASVNRYGGRITFCEPTVQARVDTAAAVASQTGAVLIHPYDDLRVMAGQGTSALEMLQDVPDLDAIVCPVGGGGQLSGISVAAKTLRPNIRIIGVEPAAADDAARSFKERRLIPFNGSNTVADGLRTSLGERNFVEILQYVDEIVTVSEEAIVRAMRMLWEVLKLVVEPSGAVAYAAVMDGPWHGGRKVGVILSGGNLDLDSLPWQKPQP